MVNMIHSEASPEELPEEVSDSEVFGTSSFLAAVATDPSRLTWVLEEEGTFGSASRVFQDRGFASAGFLVGDVASDSSSNLRS
jgi:hypothetical protein